MLKIRYDLESKVLSGWRDRPDEFELLQARKGEATVTLDIEKPDADDYEYFAYEDGELVPSGKEQSRDFLAEIDEIKAKIADYDDLKEKVKNLEVGIG